VFVGKVTSIQSNHKDVDSAKEKTTVAIKVENETNPNIMIGRHFEASDMLCSKISRASIDAIKEYFSDEISKSDVDLLQKLKSDLGIEGKGKAVTKKVVGAVNDRKKGEARVAAMGGGGGGGGGSHSAASYVPDEDEFSDDE